MNIFAFFGLLTGMGIGTIGHMATSPVIEDVWFKEICSLLDS